MGVKKDKSFWFTLPGILTGVAAVITAIAGLVTALYAAGLLPSLFAAAPMTVSPTPIITRQAGTAIAGAPVSPSLTPLPPNSTLPPPTVPPRTTVPPASITPQPVVLFKDDFFGKPTQDWRQDSLDTWKVVNNQYECHSLASRPPFSFVDKPSWRNYVVSINMRVIPENTQTRIVNLGIVGRVQDADHYYIVNLRDGIAYITRLDAAGWGELRSTPYPTQDNIWYKLSAEFNGPLITMYINDKPVISAQDSKYTNGGAGLRCSEWTVASFANFKVEELLYCLNRSGTKLPFN